MLKWTDIWGKEHDRVATAIDRLKMFEPHEGYYLAYSGGKDSDTVLALAKMAGVKFDAHYNLTTVDPPELVYHVRRHPEVVIERPAITMWQLIKKKGFLPSRWIRYCCSELKERGGSGRVVMTGIRAMESIKRSKRKMTEACLNNPTKRYFNPIIDWSSNDVWEFIHENNIAYCKLYDQGFNRLGCVMCPLSSNMKNEITLFPKIANMYYKTAKKNYNPNRMDTHITFESYWTWWINGCKGEKQNDGQTYFFE